MEPATEFAAAEELNRQQVANPPTKSARDFIELDRRQSLILARMAGLYRRLDDAPDCELIKRREDPSGDRISEEVAPAGEVIRPLVNPLSKSGKESTELECRQTAILSRLAGLSGALEGGLKRELVRPSGMPSSFVGRRSNAAASPNESCGHDERVPELSAELGENVSHERTGPAPDCAGEDGHRECGDGSHDQGVNVERRLSRMLVEAEAVFAFKRVPSDYYVRSFEERRDLLGAASVDHLCKSIVLVNTQAHESVIDCSDRNNSKYYVVVVQYTARLNAEKVRQFVYSLNNGKIPKKRFNLRLAPEEESNRLTGFGHNAVTPFGMRTSIPVMLSDAIVKLNPAFFWLGGGDVDLKLGVRTDDFVKMINPFVVDCTY